MGNNKLVVKYTFPSDKTAIIIGYITGLINVRVIAGIKKFYKFYNVEGHFPSISNILLFHIHIPNVDETIFLLFHNFRSWFYIFP